MSASRLALALGLALSTFHIAPPAEARQVHGQPVYCATKMTLHNLKSRASARYGSTLPPFDIVNARLNHEQLKDEDRLVARQFCQATLLFDNGRKRSIWYLIESPMGFAGIPGTRNVEFCVAGLDPWHVYGKQCSTVRLGIGWQTVP